MTLRLKVRRARACIATIILVAAALVPFRGISLPKLNLLSGFELSVPFSLILPLAAAIAVAWGLNEGDALLEAVASRPLPVLDAAFAVMIAIVALGACAAARAAGGTDLATAAGRNAVGYVGMMLIGRRLIGPRAAPMLPVSFMVLAALFGWASYMRLHRWAWPLADSSDTLSWVFAVALLAVGAGVTILEPDVASIER